LQYVRLGQSGLKVSRIGLGMMSYGDPAGQTWALSHDDAEPIVRRAVEAGITFFDTADEYSGGVSEEITGRLLGRLYPHRDGSHVSSRTTFRIQPGAIPSSSGAGTVLPPTRPTQ
jgi:aryl-alcohol dehydrogenase-like predicted oxidoreductase